MSRQRKTAAVLQLLRDEDLETVSRGLGVTAATLSDWRDAFLPTDEASLTTRQKDDLGFGVFAGGSTLRLGQLLQDRLRGGDVGPPRRSQLQSLC